MEKNFVLWMVVTRRKPPVVMKFDPEVSGSQLSDMPNTRHPKIRNNETLHQSGLLESMLCQPLSVPAAGFAQPV